ncbi:glycosyltransferase [Pseudidiomarina sp. 1APR75-33.1]|uniref:glycosyltransferase n=1 Tax=Pseudidiomarina terrestris TaxID=2820060 RepID=UPI002652BCD9|nr:glycosyltransferase [Pseudidiomarina sp. 1APR75-33.1]MDN7126939.1 glycosyltransferase [Pseudidiomarina sp. 1APR75-33.1]
MNCVIHVVTSPCNGGAELLVRELVEEKEYYAHSSVGVYFNNQAPCAKFLHLKSNEILINVGYRDFRAIFRIRKLIREKLSQQFKVVVHGHLTSAFYFLPLATFGLDVTLIYTEHATHNNRRNGAFMRCLERIVYSRYQKVICISNATKDNLMDWIGLGFKNKIEVIYNGARNYKLTSRNDFSGDFVRFVSVGSLIKEKGFDRTIRALATIKDLDWSYTIVGDGPLFNELKYLAESLNVGDKVRLAGWQPDPESEYKSADIQLIPSRTEGFGLVAVEGLSTGLPTIASNIPGLNEVLKQGSPSSYLVSEPDNEVSWVNEIRSCRKNLIKGRRAVEEHANDQANLFSLTKMCKNYNELWSRYF